MTVDRKFLSRVRRRRTISTISVGVVVAVALATASAGSATAATTIDGPINLGTASTFGVLGASDVTNSGPSTIGSIATPTDLGVSPGSSITGFAGAPNGTVNGTVHQTDSVAVQAQSDTGIAYDVAASLSPTSSGLSELSGLSPLIPGVYSGDALSVTGSLVLDGPANAVWVFQAASTLITGSASTVSVIGGASSCNVFWQVGSSATLGTGSTMVGTIMALASISTDGGNTVDGRLLARTGGVTLLNTTLIRPDGCTTTGTVSASPTITSGTPTGAVLGRRYSFALTSTGSAPSSYSVTGGELAPGLTLDSSTGMISGTPTTVGSYTVTIAADNGIAPPATASYRISVAALLAATGTTTAGVTPYAVGAVLLGFALVLTTRRRRMGRHSAVS